jgi:choline-sulfatase
MMSLPAKNKRGRAQAGASALLVSAAWFACKANNGEPVGVTRSAEFPVSTQVDSAPAVTAKTAAMATATATATASATERSSAAVAPAAPVAKVRNVLMISIDSLRADMPWNGYERQIAPRLTKLAKECVNYTRFYAASSYTAASLGGFLGGKIPSAMTRDGYFFARYAAKNLMLGEVLQQGGVRTLSAHAHGYFQNAGFEQGFETWKIVPGLKWNAQTDENITSHEHEKIAEAMLGAPDLAAKPFFAWFHFLDPHDQYMPHEAEIGSYGKKPRDRYDGEVTFTDLYIGRLLDFVKDKPWWKETALIITADHGELFGEHGGTRHGFEVWEELVHVPLMVCVPGIEPKTVTALRSGLDLAPTILDIVGLPVEPTFSGTSLRSDLTAPAPEERDVVVDLPATSNNFHRRALLHGDFKIIDFSGSYKTFNLKVDPKELEPLTDPQIIADMKKRLADHDARVADVPPTACGKGCLEGTKTKP